MTINIYKSEITDKIASKITAAIKLGLVTWIEKNSFFVFAGEEAVLNQIVRV